MKPWHHVALYPGDGTWMVVMGPWDVIQSWTTWDCYSWLRRQLWSFKSLWLESCENQADIWQQMSWNICSRTGIGVERCIWYMIIFGWHFYRFNVFRNQESHFQHSRRLLERPNGFVFGRRTWGWSPLRDHNQKSKGIMRRQVVGSCPK